MSSRTKIVVLHMKEIIYTVLFAAFVILLVILLFIMFRSKQAKEAAPTSAEVSTDLYVPGVYSATVALSDTSFDVQVTVDANHINSIELVNASEAVETMYPLMEPALSDLADQIIETQSIENITSAEESKYTSALLLDAIRTALAKAAP